MMMLNKNILVAATLAAAAASTVNAQDCDICAPPVEVNGAIPSLSAECKASNAVVLEIIASDSACGRRWDAFCILKYNDCYNQACGPTQQGIVDSIAATGGPGITPRPINRDQIVCSGTDDPTPRPTLPATPPPTQSAVTFLPTPCIPEVYGDCVEDCVEDQGLSVADCIDFCSSGYGGKGGKGGGFCGAKGGKGGNGGNKGGKGGKGGDYGGKGGKGGDYGGKGGKGGDYGGKGGKGGKSGYYADDCCVLAGYGAKGGKGGGYGGKGAKAGNAGNYYGSGGGGGGGGFAALALGTKSSFGEAVNAYVEGDDFQYSYETDGNGNVVEATFDSENFFIESF